MTWLFTLLAMAVIALVAGVVTGRIAGSMEPPASSLPFRGLPPGDVDPADLEQLRFDAALRGYRMSQVDGVLDRLCTELRRRDDEIAALRTDLSAVLRELNADGGATSPGPYAAGFPSANDRSEDYSPDDYSSVDDAYGAYTPPSGGFELPTRPERGQG